MQILEDIMMVMVCLLGLFVHVAVEVLKTLGILILGVPILLIVGSVLIAEEIIGNAAKKWKNA